MQTIPLIPRKLLFGNPDKAAVQISPDGRHLAYLAPRDRVMNIWWRRAITQWQPNP